MNQSDCQPWDAVHGRIFSRRGGWRIGEAVYNLGYSMMDDLAGQVSYMQVLILNAIGRMPEKRLADWAEAIHICLSWPDPRIWCNQIGALAGSSRAGVVAATTLGTLAADSRSYGSLPLIDGVGFIQQALRKYKAGESVADIVQAECGRRGGKPAITGYARPIAKGDERIPAMERVTRELGFPLGEHLQLAYEIETYLQQHHQESMNINGYGSAFLSDQGLSAEEAYRLFAIIVVSGVTACYVDSRERPAGTFLPLRCDDIDYQGVKPRELPDY